MAGIYSENLPGGVIEVFVTSTQHVNINPGDMNRPRAIKTL